MCLPSFIVIGSQKSGSTALLAHFLLHPNFVGPLRKETHFYDNMCVWVRVAARGPEAP